ncbi:MAG: alpha/beta fold hydrolase [Alphaproteobacteria bacterium]|nr:alpha/beta fold hydrolase [Alphaproteobacteria bacterium]
MRTERQSPGDPSPNGGGGGSDQRPCERVRLATPEGDIAGIWYPAETPGTRLLFCHANGFCASTYRRTFQLTDRSVEILALDLRGHGRTSLPIELHGHRSWDVYADDIALALEAAEDRFGPGPWVFAGHSLGATAAVLAAARAMARAVNGAESVVAVRLIEPVILPGVLRMLARTPILRPAMARSALVRGARNRRATFGSRAEAISAYGAKPLFAAWADGVLHDYLEDGLVSQDGGVRLSCTPEWEAANFLAQAHRPFAALESLARAGKPISVLCGARGSTVADGARRGLSSLGAHVRTLNQAGHLIPMERPIDAAGFLAGAGPRERRT